MRVQNPVMHIVHVHDAPLRVTFDSPVHRMSESIVTNVPARRSALNYNIQIVVPISPKSTISPVPDGI